MSLYECIFFIKICVYVCVLTAAHNDLLSLGDTS